MSLSLDVQKMTCSLPTLSRVQTYEGAPILSNRFETYVPRLYFIGFSKVSGCGSLFHFVAATECVASAVAWQVVYAKWGENYA